MRDGPIPQKAGIITETWKGIYEKKLVAIKILKISEGHKDYDKIKTVRQVFPIPRRTVILVLPSHMVGMIQRFYKEVVLWKRLKHRNILPVLGVSRDFAEFCLVSPWMKNGCITNYIRDNPHVNPLELVRMIFTRRVCFFPIHFHLIHIEAQRYGQRTELPPHKRFSSW